MLSWRRNESLPPSAASVTSVKIGLPGAARDRCEAPSIRRPASRTRSGASSCRHTPTCSTRHAFVPARRCRSARRCGRAGGDPAPGSIEVIRNSATVTSRRSSTSRLQLRRERTRASSVSRAAASSLAHLERRAASSTCRLDRQQAPPRKPGSRSHSSTPAGRAGPARSESPSSREPRLELLRLPLRGERVASGFELLQERLQRFRDGELRPVDGCSVLRRVRLRRRDADEQRRAGRISERVRPGGSSGGTRPAARWPTRKARARADGRGELLPCASGVPPGMRTSTSTGPA